MSPIEIPEPDGDGLIYGRWRDIGPGLRARGRIDVNGRTVGFDWEVCGAVSVVGNDTMSAAVGALSACSQATVKMGRHALGVGLEEPVTAPGRETSG